MNVKETIVRDRIVSRLKELELPTHEAVTYVTLLTHPNIPAGVLCKETGIPDSKIYYALDGLSEKGMLTVQKGNPNIYLPTRPKEAITNLKNRLAEGFHEKMKEAGALVDVLTPIYENAEKSEELEIAYIIRGQKNIINRMKALIETARKEITIFVAHQEVLKGLRESLTQAKQERQVKLNVAMTREVLEKEDYPDLGEIRLLCCPVGMIVSDGNTLLTLSDWIEETAMLSQDRNLIRVARDYYDNPSVAQACNSLKEKRHSLVHQ